MTKATFIFLVILSSAQLFGQNFQGKITYQNQYKSKVPGLSDSILTVMAGSKQEYFIKSGDYKSVTNGLIMQWQLYVNADNKLYNKMSDSETLLWNDGLTNNDEILRAEIQKDAITILGYKCDELILTCKSGTQKYYYNSKIKVDPKLFEKHRFGNWYDFVSKSKSLPLKSVIESEQFILESTATEITQMALTTAFFALPAGSKTMKSSN